MYSKKEALNIKESSPNFKIGIIDPTTDSRWDEFIANQTSSTIFHTSAWAWVIKEAYNYKPRYYVLEDTANQLRAAIPFFLVRSRLTGTRLICLPFSDACFPLGDNETDVNILVNAVKQDVETGTASYLEIRGWHTECDSTQLNLEISNRYILHYIKLDPDIGYLEKKTHTHFRQAVQQAKRRGVIVRLTYDKLDLDYFYELNVATRKKLGVLPQPNFFFRALFDYIISQKLGFLLVSEYNHRVIAGGLFLVHKDKIYYKYNASDELYLNKRPNNLILWEALCYASKNNFKTFDFGRCSQEQRGLRNFKISCGAEEADLPYFYYPNVKNLASGTWGTFRKKAMQIFSHHMPGFILKKAGSLLYKHIA